MVKPSMRQSSTAAEFPAELLLCITGLSIGGPSESMLAAEAAEIDGSCSKSSGVNSPNLCGEDVITGIDKRCLLSLRILLFLFPNIFNCIAVNSLAPINLSYSSVFSSIVTSNGGASSSSTIYGAAVSPLLLASIAIGADMSPESTVLMVSSLSFGPNASILGVCKGVSSSSEISVNSKLSDSNVSHCGVLTVPTVITVDAPSEEYIGEKSDVDCASFIDSKVLDLLGGLMLILWVLDSAECPLGVALIAGASGLFVGLARCGHHCLMSLNLYCNLLCLQ
mmetsp:Transcript_41278/g.67909  ORF Transcript_41278/g.67909 Transcript_41278/m.67909 type:complete len:280 (+) Transcript_41278:1712-2551(+)